VFGKILLSLFVWIQPYATRWIVIISYELYKLCDSIVGSRFENFDWCHVVEHSVKFLFGKILIDAMLENFDWSLYSLSAICNIHSALVEHYVMFFYELIKVSKTFHAEF
jgi:hypothetical protein